MNCIRFALPLITAGLLAACSSAPSTDGKGATVEDRSGGAASSGVDANRVVSVNADNKGGVSNYPELTDSKSILSKRSVLFDYDSYVIKSEFGPLVEAHAKFLVAHPKMKMLIQGNTDERGSREYNLSLGQKRADAVKRALVLLGVQDNQVESVSLGEEKPKNPGQDEAAYAENRRADILYRAPDGRGEF